MGPRTSTRGWTRSNLEDMGQNGDPRAEYIPLDTRRLNVAITRAKVKLVMVGDRQTLLMDFEPFKKEIVKLSQTILMNI